jgi:hypothetical protein
MIFIRPLSLYKRDQNCFVLKIIPELTSFQLVWNLFSLVAGRNYKKKDSGQV